MEKAFSKVTALILTTILCASFIPATSAQVSTEHYAFGMEYNYSNLNDDFESMSGLPLDNILADIMQSADDAGMDMVILEQTTGVSTMVVDQYMDGVETWSVDGESISMTRYITDLTIRNGALSDIALVTEWSDSYAGWDLTFTYDSDGVMNIDATYVEYRDSSGLVYGYDTTMSASMSANSDFGIYGSVNGEDAADVLPLNIEVSLGFEYDVTSASSQIRLDEPSTLNNDLANLNAGERLEWELLESGDSDYEDDWRDNYYVSWENYEEWYNIDNWTCSWEDANLEYHCTGWNSDWEYQMDEYYPYCEYYEDGTDDGHYWCTSDFGSKSMWQNSLFMTNFQDGTIPSSLVEFDMISWYEFSVQDNESCYWWGYEYECTVPYDWDGDGNISEGEEDYNYFSYCEYYSNSGGMYYCTYDFGYWEGTDTLSYTNYADRIIPEPECYYCDYADVEVFDVYDSVSGDFATSTSFDFSLTGLPAEEFGFPEGDWDLTASDSATDSGTFDESNMELDLDECGHIEFELHEGSQMITQDDGSQIEVLQAYGLPVPMPMFCQVAHLTGTALIGSDDGTTIGDILEDQLEDLFLSDLEEEDQDGYDNGIYMGLQDSSESEVTLYVEHCCDLDWDETYEVSVVLEDSNGVTTDTTSWVVSGDSYFTENVDLDVTGWGEYCATVEVKQIDEANPMYESEYCFTVDQQMEPSQMIEDIVESFGESTLENVLEIFGDNLENRMDNYEADFAYNDGDAYVLWDPVTNQIVGFQVLVTDYEELYWDEWGYCEWEGDDWNGDDMWYCADSEQDADSYGFDDYWYYCEFVDVQDEWRCTDDLGRSSNHESSSTGTQYLDSIDNEEVWWTLIGPESDEYAPAPDALSVSYFSGVQAIAVEQAVEDSSSLDDLVDLDLHDTSALDLAIEEGGDAPNTGSSDDADDTVTEDLEEGLLPFVSPAMTIVVVALAGLVASLRTRRD